MSCSAPPDCAEIERRRRDRHRPARRRRREPRQPALRRGGRRDPHRQPDGRGEAVQPGLPGVPGQRRQRDAHARPVRLGGRSSSWIAAARGDPPRRAPARAPRRHLPADASGAVRLRARPDRLGRAHRHDARAARVYATFSSYDEVAHHSGLERADTLEALRKLDDHFAQIERARRYAPRPYEIVVLSDHGQTQGATFKQRNGYGLDELVERSLSEGDVSGHRRRRRAELDGRPRRQRGDRQEGQEGQERRLRPRRRRARLGQPRAHLPDGGAPPADARGDRRAPPGAAARPARASARRLAARALLRARPGRARRPRRPLPRRRPRRGRGPARAVLAHRAAAPAAHRRLRRTSPTSWSAASTTPSSTRAARSRS